MRQDYSGVFRNLRATRRFSDDYSQYREPAWLPWIGGFAAGLIFAGLIFWGVYEAQPTVV